MRVGINGPNGRQKKRKLSCRYSHPNTSNAGMANNCRGCAWAQSTNSRSYTGDFTTQETKSISAGSSPSRTTTGTAYRFSCKGCPAFDAQRDYGQIIGWLRQRGAAPDPSQAQIDISWPNRPDEYPWPLADRVEQFGAFQDMVTHNIPQRIFLIEGLGNTGKTVLLNELFKLAKALDLSSVLLDLKGCPTLTELFDLLALDVEAKILPAFHSASGSARKTALLKDLENLRKPLLLGFDTYQHVAPDIADWIEGQFLRRAEQCPGLLVLVAGREVPNPTHYSWGGLAICAPTASNPGEKILAGLCGTRSGQQADHRRPHRSAAACFSR